MHNQLTRANNFGFSGASPAFAVAAKMNIDQDLSLQAKVNNASQLGLAYSQVMSYLSVLFVCISISVRVFSLDFHLEFFPMSVCSLIIQYSSAFVC